MAKKIKAVVKVQIAAGKATAAPPVGTALGPHGINMGQFIKDYNERTASLAGTIVPDFPLANKSFNLSYAGNDL